LRVTITELGAIGEFVGAIVVIATLVYLSIQVRQNTAQQKREETISVQRGQNEVIGHLMDPDIAGAYVRAADGDIPVSGRDRTVAITFVLLYVNQFQIVYDLHKDGTLQADRCDLWESFAVSIVAGKGIRRWWDEESGRLAFTSPVRDLIDQKLRDTANPPLPISEIVVALRRRGLGGRGFASPRPFCAWSQRVMNRLTAKILVLAIALSCGTWKVAADSSAGTADDSLRGEPSALFLLAPPKQDGPVVVHAAFEIHDINEINDTLETFDFTGVMTLTWNDPRQVFDPAPGADEKVFQGDYQFNELSTGWYPQVVMANEAGTYQKSGVLLRVQPDGTSILTETITATAETQLDMRWFPFDEHHLEAVFVVLGFDRNEVLLQAVSASGDSPYEDRVRTPQWSITGSSTFVRDRPASLAGSRGIGSAFVVSVDVERGSFFVRRLVTFPLAVIVLLSFSVFWMDRASLGDRLSVSFIGILTGVTYQLVMGDIMPHISYFTLMHAFLQLSFLTMCATVGVNLMVSELDRKGEHELGDLIDRRSRWIFPLAYFGFMVVNYLAARVFF
jgi:hypothetical protein